MTRTRLAALIAAALLWGAASTADAQPAPWQPEGGTPGWVFTPALGVGALWDSNTTLRTTGEPRIGEWVGLVNPRGELEFRGRRTRFGLGYSGALETYRNLSELTRFDQRGRLSLRQQMSPRLLFNAASSLSVSPTTERLEIGTVPFEDVGSRLLNARAGIEYAASQRTTVGAGYQAQWVDFDASAASAHIAGGHAHDGTASLRHGLSTRLSIGGDYIYRRAVTDGGQRNLVVQDATALAVYRIGEHTTIQAGAGVARLHVLETDQTRNGPSLRAQLAQGLDRAQLNLAYERTFVPSWSFGGTTTSEELRATLRVPLGGRLYAEGGGAVRRNQPLLTDGAGADFTSWWSSASLGYTAARWLRVEGFYSGSFQRSSTRGDVDRLRIGIQFVTFKPVRIQ